MDFKERTLNKNYVFNGRIISVRKDDILLPNGKSAIREVVEHSGGSSVLCVKDDSVFLVKQYRYAYGEELWEIPAGKLDKDEFDPLEAVKRELREETGYTAENYTYIGDYYPSPAILNEKISMYVATGLQKGEQDLDEDEFLEIVKIPFEKVVRMILNNEITDGKTQTAVMKAKLLLNL